MDDKQKIRVSRYLSLLLRHKPEVGGLTLDEGGWAQTREVVRALREHNAAVTMTILDEIVAEDDKTRYSFSERKDRIRANQGHSLPVNLGLVGIAPPFFLYHGTARKSQGLIWRDGLLPMSRQYVHLSTTVATAWEVGKRHGDPVVFVVMALLMHDEGFAFYRSANGVWLTSSVPVTYLRYEEEDAKSDHP